MDDLDLSGTWRAVPASEVLRRSFAEPDLDDAGWEPIAVPGHWRSAPALRASDGPVLHRHGFEAPPPANGRRTWLVLEGIFYQADVWLDGAYLGDSEGYFAPHTFEITDAARDRTEHLLAVEVACSRPDDRTAKRNITGVFQHWDCFDPDWNPGGIWRPVRVEETGPVRIRSLRVLCREATETTATIALRADLASDSPRIVELRTTVAGAGADTDHSTERSIAEGPNWVEWEVIVGRPARWWPRALGDQPLVTVTVSVALPDEGGQVSHTRSRRTGLRQLAWRDWTLYVNGERLFLKGSNQGPTRMALADATAEELRADVELAVAANLDLLRVHGHIGRRELYAAADEAGLLLWQDFPLQWGYARSIRKQAARQAWAAVETLGHHPSIAIWCGHNEPLALDVEPGARISLARTALAFAAGQQLPTWNKTVLDRTVARTFQRADGTRPVIPHSGVLPHVGSGGTDSHLYFGWYHGHERDLPGFCARFPRLARFVSEFGAQAVPASDAFCEPDRWPDLDWARLGRTHALQKRFFDRHVPPREHETFAAWRDATQAYQATVIKHHVEHLRRLKYRPTGGFCQFCFADGHPAVTWSVLDHERVAKAGYQALADACAPVIVVADRLPEVVEPGDRLELDVHAVSDLRHPIEAGLVTARLAWEGGATTWRWQGDIPADDCVRVGRVTAVVPDAPGRLILTLSLDATLDSTLDSTVDSTLDLGHAVRAANRYHAAIAGESLNLSPPTANH